MPYKLNPKDKTQIQVFKNGRWTNLKGGKHSTVEQAKSHLYMLNKNVTHKEKKK